MATVSRYSSLRNKLVLPFALLGFSVSVVLGIIAYGLVDDLSERSIKKILLVELEDFRGRRQRNPLALPIDTRLIQGYFLPHPRFAHVDPVVRFAEHPSDAATIVEGSIDGHPASMLLTTVAGQPFLLIHDDTASQASLHDLAWLLLGGVLLMTLLSILLGLRLAGNVVRPIASLLREVTERAQRAKWPDELTPLLDGQYPENEIGYLARALDTYAARLHQFVQRERHFVGDVSHELRTPIAIIRSSAEVLCESPDLAPALRARLDLIVRRSTHLAELLDAMLMLAREGESGHLNDAACPIADVIDDVVTDAHYLLAGKSVILHRDIRDRPILPVERAMAHAVISNLLSNACIHTRSGTVRVTLDTDRLIIEDTGVGIAAERFPDVFRRHVKGRNSPGAGLGLSIVARLTGEMGWKVGIESQEGVGTRVELRFAR